MKILRRPLLLCILLFPAPGLCASQAAARMKVYFRDAFLPHLWDDTRNTFGRPANLLRLGAGAALTVAAHQYDGPVNDYWKDHRLDYGLADFGNEFWGNGGVQGGLALSLMFIGWGADNARLADTGEVLVEAQLIQGALINVIKPIAGKQRPDHSDNLSFPSGHTGTAFCTAAVIHHRLGWHYGAPAYALAVVTAMSRMDVQAHWLSDTVMGAAIAMVTGYAVSRYHDDYPYTVTWKKPRLSLTPVLGEGRYGIMVAGSF
ncbi:MAG TPA: phosphatase PAP2 family protein [bacterium]|nr:phosphatase PAP2 family protein [bacterium]